MIAASLPMRSLIEARLARTLHQAVLARAIADAKPELVEAAREALVDVERALGGNPRMERLAQRLSLGREEVEFLWATSLISLGPSMPVRIRSLSSKVHADRGGRPHARARRARS